MRMAVKLMRDRLIKLLQLNPHFDVLWFGGWEEIADYLLENGVIVPPCKVGQIVYQIQPTRKRVQAYEVTAYKFNGRSYFFSWVLKDREGFYENVEGFSDIQIGKTVFLTREEAEKALKEGVQE